MPDRPAWVANYLPGLQRLGLSATAALRTFRAPPEEGGMGLRVSTSEFYRQWGATLHDLATREGFLPVNLSHRPTAEQTSPLPARKATGWFYRFDVLVHDERTGETFYKPSGFRTDTLVRWSTAKAAAVDAIEAAAEEGSPTVAGLTVLGAVPISVSQYVPA